MWWWRRVVVPPLPAHSSLPWPATPRRAMLGLKPDVDSPEALASAPQQQQQQPQQQQAPTSVRGGGEGATAGLPVRSRILEHTASSLARCNATLQHAAGPQSQAAAAAAPAAVAGPAPSFRSFGSPLPPLRSRPGSSLEQRDGSSTPVGVEGLTPEAPAGGWVGWRARCGARRCAACLWRTEC